MKCPLCKIRKLIRGIRLWRTARWVKKIQSSPYPCGTCKKDIPSNLLKWKDGWKCKNCLNI